MNIQEVCKAIDNFLQEKNHVLFLDENVVYETMHCIY